MKTARLFVLLVIAVVCFSSVLIAAEQEIAQSSETTIRLAATTSAENTGLLDVLLPRFQEKYGIRVEVVSVGKGAAMKLGKQGDVDVILVHDRPSEDEFVAEGYGVNRRDLMHNDFVIVGPPTDPAGTKGQKDAAEALKKIALNKSLFISRGDDSGTHSKERSLWEAARLKPKGDWYVEVGQGMGAVLVIADEKQGYTLTDRGTYLAYEKKVDLALLVEGECRLINPYAVIAVNPAKHPHVKYVEAMTFIAWLTSKEGQEMIGGFNIGGKTLFFPDAIPQEEAGN
jgi:tungstate transport system substrate-binding protein